MQNDLIDSTLTQVSGQPLHKLCGTPMEIDAFLRLATGITSTLAELHQQNIIHKGICPKHIQVNYKTGDATIIDFSSSSRLPYEYPIFHADHYSEESLPYISPEQTGLTNCILDSRSDLYSLGITFYEMLTGRLPFQAQDINGWIRSHLFFKPASPKELISSIPVQISNIVMRLVSKFPHERYQTARGLKHDLQKCLTGWQSSQEIHPFDLGEHDIPERLYIPVKLYGRDEEKRSLFIALDRIRNSGFPELIIISGPQGIGKKALAQELRLPVYEMGGFFAPAKCSSTANHIPYSAVCIAFQETVAQILKEDEKTIEQWREKILHAVGADGRLITDVIPNAKKLIGALSSVPRGSPFEERNRFLEVFLRFASVLAQEQHPLLLFIKDLQWADAATFMLLEHIMTQPETRHLLLIATCPDDVPNVNPDLHSWFRSIRNARLRVQELHLQGLTAQDTYCLLHDCFRAHQDGLEEFSCLIHKKTAGNPYLMIQVLSMLHDEAHLRLNKVANRWEWDLAALDAALGKESIQASISRKFEKLPINARELLKLIACVDDKVSVTEAAMFGNLPCSQAQEALDQACNERLVVRGSDETFFFPHEILRQAAFSLVLEEDLAAVNMKIGRKMLGLVPSESLNGRIFSILKHLNTGSTMVTDRKERSVLAELNLAAGLGARGIGALEAAYHYLQCGLRHVDAQTWLACHDLGLAIHEEAAEIAYWLGLCEQSEKIVDEALLYARSNIEKAKLYIMKIESSLAVGRTREAIVSGLECLRTLGMKFPASHGRLGIYLDSFRLTLHLMCPRRKKRLDDLINLPQMEDPRLLSCTRVLAAIIPAALESNPTLLPLLVLKGMRLLSANGNSPHAAVIYTAYGLLLCALGGHINSGVDFAKLAIDVTNRSETLISRIPVEYIYNALIRHWKEHLRESLPALSAMSESATECSLRRCALDSMIVHSRYLFSSGEDLGSVETSIDSYTHSSQYMEKKAAPLKILRQTIANIRSVRENPCLLVGDHFDEAGFVDSADSTHDKCALFLFYFNKLLLSCLFDNHHQALEYSTLARENLPYMMGSFEFAQYHFYDSLPRLALVEGLPRLKRARFLCRVRSNQKMLKKWAKLAPMNHLHRYYLVQAEMARIRGKDSKARDAYDKSIEAAAQNRFIYEEALANERAAAFHLNRGRNRTALKYLTDAISCYDAWGAEGKVRHLEQTYATLLKRDRSPESTQPRSGKTAERGMKSYPPAYQKDHRTHSFLMFRFRAVGNAIVIASRNLRTGLSSLLHLLKTSLTGITKAKNLVYHLRKQTRASSKEMARERQIFSFSWLTPEEHVPADVAGIIKEALKTVHSSLPENVNLQHHLALSPEEGFVLADPAQVYLLTKILCSRAICAMVEEGGMLSVSLSSLRPDISMTSRHPLLMDIPYVCLTVSDTGRGVDASCVKFIFDFDVSSEKSPEDSELYMTIVQNIARNHGGEIIVYSEAGRGTTFHAFLPQSSRKTTSKESDSKLLPIGTEHIMIVMSEAPLLSFGKVVLEMLGYRISCSMNSIEALETFRSEPQTFDLIVADSEMPFLSCREFSMEISSIRPSLPVVQCTGSSEIIKRYCQSHKDFRSLLAKPHLVSNLARLIRKVLDSK